MGWDRYITWEGLEEGRDKPSIENLALVLQDYLGDLGQIDNMGQENSLYATLMVGPKSESYGSFPFHRMASLDKDFREAQQRHLMSRERWFEVHRDDDYVTITTRQQDELTNNIATGFAQLVARFWKGQLDLGG